MNIENVVFNLVVNNKKGPHGQIMTITKLLILLVSFYLFLCNCIDILR